MKKLLNEMPWIAIDHECPYCNTPIGVEDYRLELWDEEPLSFRSYWTRKLFNDRVVPVLCPNKKCPGKTFLYDKDTHVAVKIKPDEDINKLLKKYADRFIISNG